ncbi:hypothetical protein LCX93_05125 [Sulfurimonas sp. SWIR-19]|uniref:hypothetical protein n=1 Tax=Sulfurimonas sp. SWIR-19 TaxID=2878390 RepID=UPI001CF3FBC2|nr:hypothetical protein [Sulfurimonas sp. SWIR-19]UCN01301.1 hypothetical protein LCX93_05125 [Sulfurimonas sp. SWIR-19]
MKYAFIFFFTAGMKIFACSGDCIACHPTLVDVKGEMDNNHQILQRCKTCHRDGSKIVLLDTNSSNVHFKIVKIKTLKENSHTECGNDCWQCHDIKKVSQINIPEHKNLQKCIECHVKLDKTLLEFDSPKDNATLQDVLKI